MTVPVTAWDVILHRRAQHETRGMIVRAVGRDPVLDDLLRDPPEMPGRGPGLAGQVLAELDAAIKRTQEREKEGPALGSAPERWRPGD